MSISFLKRHFIFEAEDDEQQDMNASTEESQEQNSDDNFDIDTSDDTDDENADGEEDDNENSDETSDSNDDEAEDFDIDTSDDADDADNEVDDNDDSIDDSDDMSDNDDSDGESSSLDDAMFNSLSEGEKKRKIYVLKKQYIDLYSDCSSLIDKFNQISSIDKDDVNTIIKRILKILYKMREYISYYVTNSFDSESYLKNDVTFNEYLAVLNGIKLTLIEIEKAHYSD